MLGLGLVRPLEDDWRGTLDGVARQRRWPSSQDVAELAARVAALSTAYNDAAVARLTAREAGAARLGFSFARDVPKGAAAVRELVATGTLLPGAGPMRLLDVGAGLGATTWGVARALEAFGFRGEIEATWVDSDAFALELGLEVVRRRHLGPVALRPRAIRRDASTRGALEDLGRFDVVLVGQLLSELDIGSEGGERVDRHASLLAALLESQTAEHGSLVVIEPALRDRTRHLHAVRDRLVSLGATVFAPCTHAAPCPALIRESDWCHEDVPIDLPAWLVPVARAAGLRREGLTFSYFVLRKDGVCLATRVPAPPPDAPRPLRVVSARIPSKGKSEVFVCGEIDGGDAPVVARVKASRLNRDARGPNAVWGELERGDIIVVEPTLRADRPRIGDTTTIQRVESR